MPKPKSIWRDSGAEESDSLLEPHLAEPYQAWKAQPGPETANGLLKAVEPTLHEALRTYAGPSAGNPSLLGRAKVMALKAFEGYDPSRAKLRTHLLSQLQGLRRHAARSESLVRVPEGSALALAKLRRAEEELLDAEGREPSTLELSTHTGLSPTRIAKLRKNAPRAVAEGQVTRVDTEGAGTWTPPTLSGPASRSAQKLWLDLVYNESDPVDQVILERSLALYGKSPLSNLQIARKLKLSPGAVSQRRLRIQKRLDLAGEAGLLPE